MTDTSGRVSEVGFTPGPWEWDGCAQIVESARPHMRVCFMPSDADRYANGAPTARLIAAAPELYEALKALANAADDVGVHYFDTDTLPPEVEAMQRATEAARAALSKATQKAGT